MMKKLAIATALAATLSTMALGTTPAEAHGKKFHWGGFKFRIVQDYDYCYWKRIKVYDEYYGWHWVKVRVCN